MRLPVRRYLGYGQAVREGKVPSTQASTLLFFGEGGLMHSHELEKYLKPEPNHIEYRHIGTT